MFASNPLISQKTKLLGQLLNAALFTIMVVGCRPQDASHPCEPISCLNGGTCVNGVCDCPDGFEGELCELIKTPDAAWISGIEVNGYPTFRGQEPWDGTAPQPDCWPDLAVGIDWPWGLLTQSQAKLNAEGNPLFWGEPDFPYLDNHFHAHDTVRIFLVELDGLDSTEVIGPPELLFEAFITLDQIVLLDEANPFPTAMTLASDTSELILRCAMQYEFDH